MAAPDPFGTIVNAITLGQLLYTSICDFVAAEKDEEQLVAQMRLSNVTLERFITAFRDVLTTKLTPSEQLAVSAACDALQPELRKTLDALAKISSEDSKLRRFGLKIAWMAWRKKQLEAVVTNMRHWSELFHELKDSISCWPKCDDRSATGTRPSESHVGAMSKSFTSLAVEAATADARRLKRELAAVHVGSKSGKIREATYANSAILIEYKSYDTATDTARTTYIEEQLGRLSNFLSLTDPITTGILTSAGYVHDPDNYRFGMLFNIPRGYEVPAVQQDGPITLRSIIAQGTPAVSDPSKVSYAPRHALDARVSVACMIAVALYSLHTYGWVHENLRTSNVLILLERTPTPTLVAQPYALPSLGRPFLLGYESARSKDGVYSIGGYEQAATEAEQFATDIFQHPDRQGLLAGPSSDQLRYQMSHDRYSLGVVLLEIGLWLPLHREKALRKVREQYGGDEETRRSKIRESLIGLAQERLAIAVGQRYQNIVMGCLHAKATETYDLSRFLYEVILPLWELRSCL